MRAELYNIFRECFPLLIIDEELFFRKISYDISRVFTIYVEEHLVGYSIIHKNVILLLCVLEKYQGKGLGTKLLEQSEDYIKSAGYSRIYLGYGKNDLFQGVPLDSENGRKLYQFFKKRGYLLQGKSVDMIMKLNSYSIDYVNIQKPVEEVHLRYANNKDKKLLDAVVAEVEPSWCEYYKKTDCPILLACKNKEILGFCILSTDNFFKSSLNERVGGIGCVGVIPSARRCGIGGYLVAVGTEELKRMGCTTAYIHSTELEKWYSKIGYQTFLRFFIGVKQVPICE